MADEGLAERVLRAVELIPPGRVASYGDIAAVVGIGPRHVGNVLAKYGSGVPWWRVTNRLGEIPPSLLEDARRHWEHEIISVREDGRGCHLSRHRVDLEDLALRWEQAVADIPQ